MAIAKITEFTGLTTVQGYTSSGLSIVNGSQNSVIVVGQNLNGLNIKVVERPATTRSWQGTLATNPDFPGRFDATLTCNYGSSSTGTSARASVGAGDGDPADVPITVSVGADLNNPTLTYDTAIPIGIGAT